MISRVGCRGLRSRRGATLVEAMIAVVIVAVTGLAIIFGVAFGIKVQQAVRERNAATRVAGETIESTRRALFATLSARTVNNVLLDDRGTPANAQDDVTATVNLRFEDMDGNEVGTVATPMPLDRSMVRVVVDVTWRPAGRTADSMQTISMASLLAP